MTPPDAARLLAAVADALNGCEQAGITVKLAHGTVVTEHGYVLASGDSRLGSRWQGRPRRRLADAVLPGDSEDYDGTVLT